MRRNPLEELETAIERMTNEFGGGMAPTLGESVPVDVLDGDDAYVVTADLPGFEADDVEVTLDGGVLRIQAERETETEHDAEDETTGERYLYHERGHETVSRTVRLPEAVDEEAVTANHSNGVLTVELPKAAADEEGYTIEVE